MQQNICIKSEKRERGLAQKFIVVAKYALSGVIISCFVYEVYFVHKTLIEFILMCEYYVRLYILNHLISI